MNVRMPPKSQKKKKNSADPKRTFAAATTGANAARARLPPL